MCTLVPSWVVVVLGDYLILLSFFPYMFCCYFSAIHIYTYIVSTLINPCIGLSHFL